MFISPLRSLQPLEPNDSRTAALEAGFQPSPSRRDGDVVQSLHTQPPVELVLAPIGLDTVDGPISHMQEPDLVQVHELLLVDDKVELTYDDAGIVGFKDGWTIEDGGFMQLNEMVTYCEELKMDDPTWKAPLIRMGSWVVASPSEYTHTNKWLHRAWKAYGKGVMDGTEEKREDDGNYWTDHWPYYNEE